MPRAARVQYEGAQYHILNRGNYRKDITVEKKSAPWKLAIASHLKSRSGIKNPQLCGYLNLGHPATMSNLVGTYTTSDLK